MPPLLTMLPRTCSAWTEYTATNVRERTPERHGTGSHAWQHFNFGNIVNPNSILEQKVMLEKRAPCKMGFQSLVAKGGWLLERQEHRAKRGSNHCVPFGQRTVQFLQRCTMGCSVTGQNNGLVTGMILVTRMQELQANR
jgi:hypothetical protein